MSDRINQTQDRLIEALWRRAPKEGLARWRREVGGGIDRHPDSLENWMAGTNAPDLDSTAALCSYFGRAFRNEVFPTPDDDPPSLAQAYDQIARIRKVLSE